MAILWNEKTKIFQLDTRHTTYQFQVDGYGRLLHLYYGTKVVGDLSYLLQKFDVGFSGNPYDAKEDRTYSYDLLPQEFPSFGVGDYRVDCIEVVNEDGSRAADFSYESHTIEKGAHSISGMPALYDLNGEAQTLEVCLKDKVTGLELSLYYTVFEEQDVIARSAKVGNANSSSMILERMLSACLELPSGDFELLHFHGRHAMERLAERVPLVHGNMYVGSKRGTSSHQHNPGVILCHPSTTEDQGECYGMALVYSSNFIADVELNQMSQARVVMGIHPQHFHYTLEAMETFETPQVILSYSDGGLGQLSYQFHEIIRHHLCRGKHQFARRPILINNWEATYFDFNKEKIIGLAKQAKELGIEMLVLDDGWFGKRNQDDSGLGDWFVNEEKLGGSLKELVDEVNTIGLKFGLWFEPEMVSENSELYRNHPEWVLAIPGRRPCRSRYQLVLDLSREDVRDYLFTCISSVLDSANIAYIKWDMNRSMCDIYSQLEGIANQGEVYHRCMLGVYELLERIICAYPDLLLEGCSGGGGRFDPAMLYYSPQIWCSDDTDAIERLEIQYGTSFFYPISSMGAHVSASPNHQTGRNTPMVTRGVVAMAGTFGYELDLNQVSLEEKAEIQKQIRQFHHYYDVIQHGRYYRLMSPYDKSGITCWQMVSKDQSKALVSAVCSHVRANLWSVRIQLKGLKSGASYQIEGSDDVYTGSALMYGGIYLPIMQGEYPSIQLYFIEIS